MMTILTWLAERKIMPLSPSSGKRWNPTVAAAWIASCGAVAAATIGVLWLEPLSDVYEPSEPFDTFRDCPECPEMVLLPAGTFLMGSPETENGRYDNEGPQHEVTISKPFAIGKFEVTFADYDRFTDETHRVPLDFVNYNFFFRKGRIADRERQPVVDVSWKDADAYCFWLGTETAKTYRLPTEAEWEYAARAGTPSRYSFGDEVTEVHANLNGNKGATSHHTIGILAPKVGSYRANDWGLHDMHGNVAEWASDWYGRYPSGSVTDPNGPRTGEYRVVRGGSWITSARRMRSAYRSHVPPTGRSGGIGFRCVRVIKHELSETRSTSR